MELAYGASARRGVRGRGGSLVGQHGSGPCGLVRLLACVAMFLVLPGLPAAAQHAPITFSVIGDVPYDPDELEDLLEHVDNHNRMSPSDFLVHLGDILGDDEECTEPSYQQVAEVLLGLAVPAFLIPGDNEWTDCADPNQGWAFWETYFGAFEENFCAGPPVERQVVRPENFAFVSKGVLFIGINLVGGDPADDDAWAALVQQDLDWIDGQFTGKAALVRAAVIFAHAGPGLSAHDLFFDGFGPLASAFAKPILYTMGDGHSWVVDKPFAEQNVTRLQVERGTDPPPQITVGLDPLAPFTILRDPWPSGTPDHNRSPCVDVGADASVDLAGQADLDGWVVDDGVPGAIATSWSQLAGPGQAFFADPLAPQTSVRFDSPGTYLLQLAAHDGERLTTGTLSVDVSTSAPTLTIDDVLVDEGGDALFSVRLHGGTGGPVSVDVASADATAHAPGDYTPTSGTLAFSGPQVEATVSVPVLHDGLVESTEDFRVTLSGASGAVLARPVASALVLDVDSAPAPWISGFEPGSGPVGTELEVDGAGFLGALDVQVAGAPASSFAVESDRRLRATVASGSWLGPVAVTTPAGSGQSAGAFAATLPKLTVSVDGPGSVEVDPPGDGHAPGTLLTVTAMPAPGFDFAGWSGDLAGFENPAMFTLQADRTGVAHFEALPPGTVSLDVSVQGPGSVSASPPGRLHGLGSSVTLTATPEADAFFLGWGGDLAGSASPTLLEMTASRAVSASFSRAGLPIVREDYEKGSASELASVSTDDSMDAVAGDLYLAAVTTRRRVNTLQVEGLGLDWTELVDQCSRQNQTSVSLWWALGVPSGNSEVTAHFDAAADNASLIVSRYSGVDAAEPFGPVPAPVSGNANGVDGACSGGVDTESYALPLSTARYESVVHAAIASSTRHSPGTGWTEITERRTGSGPLLAGLAAVERQVPVPTALLVEGELADEADWAAVAVELQRQGLMLPRVSDFSPASGQVGTEVVVLGNGFGNASAVTFGGVPAESFSVDTWARLRAVVPSGAQDGPIGVQTAVGSGTSLAGFDVLAVCSDGIDNDGDGAADFPADLGCEHGSDTSEHSSRFACDNGLDDDLDGLVDLLDPGCQLAISPLEDPECDDDLDNDGDGTIDWDGGSGGGTPDPFCNGNGWAYEVRPACGTGFELALLLPWLGYARMRRQR